MPMMGTCWKREGTHAFLYSRKGAWKYPMEIKGIDPLNVMVGHRYSIDDNKNLSHQGENGFFEKDLAEHSLPDLRARGGTSPSQPAGAANAAAPSTTAGKESPRLDGLLASATGVVKSCLDNGLDPMDAMTWGAYWAGLWGWHTMPRPLQEVVKKSLEGKTPPMPAPAPAPAPKPETVDPDDEIPF